MSKHHHKLLLLNMLSLFILFTACSSEKDELCPADAQPLLVEVSFAPSLGTESTATRALTTVMGEAWEHEINDLWVLLVKKNAAGQWVLRYKFHFDTSCAMDASPLSVTGGLTLTTGTLPLRYTTSQKTVEAGDYYPLYFANVPAGSILDDELHSIAVSNASVDTFLKTILTTATGAEGVPTPMAYEWRDPHPASTARLLATNAFRISDATGLPVGQWPGFDTAQPLSITTSHAVTATLFRSLAKFRLFLRTTEKNGTFIPEAAGFTLQSVSILNAPTHGYLVWNSRTPSGELSPAGAYGGYASPDNRLQNVALDISRLPLLNAIHCAPIGYDNLLDGTTPALNCYLKADAEMEWSPAMPGMHRSPATMVQLVMARGASQSFTYQIPILPTGDPYPYLMANRCYDLHLCFRGPGTGFEVSTRTWVDTGAEPLSFE